MIDRSMLTALGWPPELIEAVTRVGDRINADSPGFGEISADLPFVQRSAAATSVVFEPPRSADSAAVLRAT